LRTFYELLSVPPEAPTEEIKKAFRREIARYHPDKVQHLGQEFQEMAAGIAADLTEAYRILMDPALRAKYDEDLAAGGPPGTSTSAPPPPARPEPSAPQAAPAAATVAPPPPRPASTAGIDFVRKASLSRLREAIDEVLEGSEALAIPGFDIAVASNPRRGLFKKADEKVRVLAKFVPQVDADAVIAVWAPAAKAQAADATLCVLLVGPGMAPARDLAGAVSEQRRKGRTAGPVLVPVDVRDWDALFPPDTPAPVRSVIQRLKEEKR
jgi:curved DNA-binding protein CbpA